MKRLLTAAVACAALVGPAMAETRNVSGFSQVSASGNYDVQVTTGDHFAVEVSGADASHIQTRLRGHELRIEADTPFWRGDTPHMAATVNVTLPRLDGLDASRGITMRVLGVQTRDMRIKADTGAIVEISGACTSLSVDVSTGGEVKGESFRCDSASASASTGGVVQIYAADDVSASATLGGSIRVAGSPTVHGRSTSFGGEVRVN